MAGEVREVLAAAQEAELRGDAPTAVSLLLRAADLYEEAGSLLRAQKMLRHVLRLDAGRADVAARLALLEEREAAASRAADATAGEGEEVLALPGASDALEAAAREALALLEAGEGPEAAGPPASGPPAAGPPAAGRGPAGAAEEGAPGRHARRGAGGRAPMLVERAPTLADPDVDAWCSFCCRPGREVGRLVAGPTGSYVCAACARLALGLLGAPEGADAARAAAAPRTPAAPAAPRAAAPAPAALPRPPRPPAPLAPSDALRLTGPLFGRGEVLSAVAAARRHGAARLLLVGPEGAGRSACLRYLAAEAGAGLWGGEPGAPPDGPLHVDDVERLSADAVERLAAVLAAEPGRPAVLAVRGTPAPAPLQLEGPGGRVPLWTGGALAAVAPGLPPALAAHVQQVVAVRVPEEIHLERLCEHLLARLRPDVRAPPELVALLAAEAARAPRLLHELEALVRRLPAGAWRPLAPPSREESPP